MPARSPTPLTVTLTADVSGLDEDDKRMLELLIEASQAMDDAFWKQAYGDKGKLLASIAPETSSLRDTTRMALRLLARADLNHGVHDLHIEMQGQEVLHNCSR